MFGGLLSAKCLFIVSLQPSVGWLHLYLQEGKTEAPRGAVTCSELLGALWWGQVGSQAPPALSPCSTAQVSPQWLLL